MKDFCIAGFGEVMLRLCPKGKKRFAQSLPGELDATFGGGEANVCASIAMLGGKSRYLTSLPDNPVARAFAAQLAGIGSDVSRILFSKTGRMGVYYAEHGSNMRGSNVIYDREYSTISMLDKDAYDFNSMLDGVTHLHLSGITPALAPNCRQLVLDMLKVASAKGMTVSFDGNFRSTLWTWEEARDFCTECLPYVNILLGIEPYHLWKDENDHSKGDWKDGVPLHPSYEQQDEIFQRFVERYPNIQCIARHVRYAHSGSENSLKAFMWYEGHTFESKLFTFNILDRVGGGDAFASGLIYAMIHNYKPMDMINFAVASSVIKHTIHGDANITDDVKTIKNLANMNYDIKR